MLATIFIALASLGAADLGDDVITVQAEGTAAGTGAEARREATANAQLAAVVDCVEGLGLGKDLLPFKPILDAAPSYIRSFRRTDVKVGEKDTVVAISARVFTGRVRRDAADLLLPQLPEGTRILVLIAERIGAEKALGLVPAGEAEINLVEWLRNAGLDVVNPVKVRARHSEEKLLSMLRDNDRVGGRVLAREHLAQVAILGMCTVDRDPGGGLPTNRARLELRIIDAEEGKVQDTVSAESVLHSAVVGHGALVCIQDACERLRADLLSSTVLVAAVHPPKGGVTLTIEGVGEAGQVDAVIDQLVETPGITNLEEIYRGKGEVQFRVDYEGPLASFAKALTGQSHSGFRVEMRRAVGREVCVRLKR